MLGACKFLNPPETWPTIWPRKATRRGPCLPAETCSALAALYDDDERFRKRIVMEQHAYGKGEYKYFGYPLPDAIAALRAALYPPLAVSRTAGERRWEKRARAKTFVTSARS